MLYNVIYIYVYKDTYNEISTREICIYNFLVGMSLLENLSILLGQESYYWHRGHFRLLEYKALCRFLKMSPPTSGLNTPSSNMQQATDYKALSEDRNLRDLSCESTEFYTFQKLDYYLLSLSLFSYIYIYIYYFSFILFSLPTAAHRGY
jgi:hypothetical protein